MKCEDCPYYWKDESDDFPCCHFDETYHPTPSPCEWEDETEDYYEEY